MKKYSIDDFQGLTPDERMLAALTAVSNELHNIYAALHEIKEKEAAD